MIRRLGEPAQRISPEGTREVNLRQARAFGGANFTDCFGPHAGVVVRNDPKFRIKAA
jgi:hypothetical protein